ncbi:MAG: hypothetical protein AAF543_08040 [Pseudomonadota bacterium]
MSYPPFHHHLEAQGVILDIAPSTADRGYGEHRRPAANSLDMLRHNVGAIMAALGS